VLLHPHGARLPQVALSGLVVERRAGEPAVQAGGAAGEAGQHEAEREAALREAGGTGMVAHGRFQGGCVVRGAAASGIGSGRSWHMATRALAPGRPGVYRIGGVSGRAVRSPDARDALP